MVYNRIYWQQVTNIAIYIQQDTINVISFELLVAPQHLIGRIKSRYNSTKYRYLSLPCPISAL